MTRKGVPVARPGPVFTRRALLGGAVVAGGLYGFLASGRRHALDLPVVSDVALVGEAEASAGWTKGAANPVLGGSLGTCFDVCLVKLAGIYRMYFSWRPRGSIALVESADGVHWGHVRIALAPRSGTGWEDRVNRPIVLQRRGIWHMWYTGQTARQSWIGHAASADGLNWVRSGRMPVLSPQQHWEGAAVMCPDVQWDEAQRLYRMWYSGGDQNEPHSIGYATSADGIQWSRRGDSPIFSADPAHPWERDRVTACQVVVDGDWHVMFYIGFYDTYSAHIGLARSRDGITQWQRHPANPILRPGRPDSAWDHDAVYKPFALRTARGWTLWYNGRHGFVEQIGLATHAGHDLGFPPAITA